MTSQHRLSLVFAGGFWTPLHSVSTTAINTNMMSRLFGMSRCDQFYHSPCGNLLWIITLFVFHGRMCPSSSSQNGWRPKNNSVDVAISLPLTRPNHWTVRDHQATPLPLIKQLGKTNTTSSTSLSGLSRLALVPVHVVLGAAMIKRLRGKIILICKPVRTPD